MPTKEWRQENRDKCRKHQREWYQRNKAVRFTEVRDRKAKIVAWLKEYKRKLTCSSCGFSDSRALQFHHRDAASKEISVCEAAGRGWSLARIMTEIEKCDVLCANCHSIQTYTDGGWD